MISNSIRRWAFLVGSLLLALPFACTKESNRGLPPNQPPTTFLSIQGNLPDTLDYRLALHWWGSDRDGQIKGYYIRWSGPWKRPEGAPRGSADTSWVFTTSTADTFAAPTGPTADTCAVMAAGVDTFVVVAAVDTFQVRAVDDQDMVDPVGRREIFPIKNAVPTVKWDPRLSLPVTSVCVVSFAVAPKDGNDENGISTVHLQYWLDGSDSTRAWETTDNVIVLTPDEFGGRYGSRTLSVRAIDDSRSVSGGRKGILRHTWTVEPPPDKKYLLIDNVPYFVSGSGVEDAYYTRMMSTVVPDDYNKLDLAATAAFRTSGDVFRFLTFFRGVVWYSGYKNTRNDAAFRATLAVSQTGIGKYLDQGGRLLLVSTNAVGDLAGLDRAFAEDRLGLNGFYTRGAFPFDFANTDTLYSNVTGDSTRFTGGLTSYNVDYMIPRPVAVPLFWVRPGLLRPAFDNTIPAYIPVVPDQSTTPAYLGVLRQAGNSRFAVITFLLSRMKGLNPADNPDSVAVTVFRKVLLDTP